MQSINEQETTERNKKIDRETRRVDKGKGEGKECMS
jgi:hypothetical protein